MDVFRVWREHGLCEVNVSDYEQAWQRFGGSVITHPLIVKTMSDMTSMPLRYLGYEHKGILTGVIPVWGKYICGSKSALRKAGKNKVIDMGNSEYILPLNPLNTYKMRFRVQFLSDLHRLQIINSKRQGDDYLSLVKNYGTNSEHRFSKKFKYNQRRELRLFEEAGGYVKKVEELSTEVFAGIYIDLFGKRWNGRKPKGYERLAEWLTNIRHLHTGHVLYNQNNQPVAVQQLLMAQSPKWISAEYINGGVDPAYQSMSVGSILSYLNTKMLSDLADSQGKQLRYSFGKSDKKYKDMWCYRSEVFKV